ncbi:SHOCT domain-containing protein [Methylobacterium sp. J-076]|uniref:SHOCT domain-containing protein n=1 Tax=Methylobacterium sp. J-076 TaxID=2836655 RepID=UPI001FBBCA37|nr:SHOCT domain-containing protein [Methylobacterium sp. J-076]MCJ2013524.1 SHOCT domain-containing protein [Methylobacterium sp. J-076]
MTRLGETGSQAEGGFLDGGGFDHASGLQTVADRHGVSLDAVRHLLRALERGHGRMAQFDHPDLGGLGQWTSGGMTMVGRMFDDALKSKVAALCTELAATLPAEGYASTSSAGRPVGAGEWWPGGLGRPSSTGSQDGMRYAYFPESRRLAIDEGSGVVVYDTAGHEISGVSQSNGLVRFSGAAGPVALDRLSRVGAEAPAVPSPSPRPPEPAPPVASGDVLATIERLADLHARGVLTSVEFQNKKAELLARL